MVRLTARSPDLTVSHSHSLTQSPLRKKTFGAWHSVMRAECADVLRERGCVHLGKFIINRLECCRKLHVVHAEFNTRANKTLEWGQETHGATVRCHHLARAFACAGGHCERESGCDESVDLLPLECMFHSGSWFGCRNVFVISIFLSYPQI